MQGAEDKLWRNVPFTSITLNSGFASRLHRDSHNFGVSVAIATGHFKRDRLRY